MSSTTAVLLSYCGLALVVHVLAAVRVGLRLHCAKTIAEIWAAARTARRYDWRGHAISTDAASRRLPVSAGAAIHF